MNAYARSLRCFRRGNLFIYLIVIKMVGWKLEHLEVEGPKPT